MTNKKMIYIVWEHIYKENGAKTKIIDRIFANEQHAIEYAKKENELFSDDQLFWTCQGMEIE